MTTSRLERAIAKLHSMNHEEYANFLEKHTKSDNCEVNFAHIDAASTINDTHCTISFNEIISSSDWENIISSNIKEIYQTQTIYFHDQQRFDAVFTASNPISSTPDSYKVAA
jgi:hypothetical protein